MLSALAPEDVVERDAIRRVVDCATEHLVRGLDVGGAVVDVARIQLLLPHVVNTCPG